MRGFLWGSASRASVERIGNIKVAGRVHGDAGRTKKAAKKVAKKKTAPAAAKAATEVQRRMRERVWEAAHFGLSVVTLDTDTTVHTLFGWERTSGATDGVSGSLYECPHYPAARHFQGFR